MDKFISGLEGVTKIVDDILIYVSTLSILEKRTRAFLDQSFYRKSKFFVMFSICFFFVRLDCSVAFMSSSADCHIQCLVDPDFNPSVASVYNSYRQFSRPGGSRFSFTIL